MINKLVFENLRHRPVRTLLSTAAIGVQVTMMLTLVGLSRGFLQDQQRRSRGIGADLIIRAPGAAILSLNAGFSEKFIPFLEKQPHVVLATGALMQATGPFSSITGLDLPRFEQMSGRFRFSEGRVFEKPDEVIVDEYYARQHKLHAGDRITVLNRPWRVSGIFEPGKLARLVIPLSTLQELTANSGKVMVIYVKLDAPANTPQVIDYLKANGMGDYQILSMEELLSQFSVENIPMLQGFIWVVIALGVVVGFLVVFLSMYTAVLERTREIGVLKALGASPVFVLNVLLRETTLLAILGAILGIVFTYGTRWLVLTFAPGGLIQAIVPDWWPIAAAIALAGALLGAAWPGLKAARQDAIEALSYE
ncbi:MAG: FtsX-like permease family protein [Bryobacteraceae bacterium]